MTTFQTITRDDQDECSTKFRQIDRVSAKSSCIHTFQGQETKGREVLLVSLMKCLAISITRSITSSAEPFPKRNI